MVKVDLAIVTALPQELAPVTARWGVPRPRIGEVYFGASAGASAGTGTDARRVAAYATGPGTVAAAIGVTRLLHNVAPELLVAGGIAGGIAMDTPGGVVFATHVGYYDVDCTALGAVAGSLQRGSSPLLRAPMTLPPASLGERDGSGAENPREGVILTGDSFLTAELVRALPPVWRERITDALAVDMESAAWAEAAHRVGVPWCVTRLVSDTININRVGSESTARLPFTEACRRAGELLWLISRFLLSDTGADWYDEFLRR